MSVSSIELSKRLDISQTLCCELGHYFLDRYCANAGNRLGTFYNATPGAENKLKVKEWAWAAYPTVYEELLKLGQYKRIRYDEDDEEVEEIGPTEAFFEIGPIGRDADP